MFAPITIGGITFKNRIWAAPARPHLLYEPGQHWPGDHLIAYYAEKAKGGSACITISAQLVNQSAAGLADDVTLPEGQTKWRRLTDTIHFYGAKASLEIGGLGYTGFDEEGNQVSYSVNGGEVNPDGTVCVPFTEYAMKEISQRYANAAQCALECGFDMVLIHGGHGVPLFQMLSPKHNHRTDEFGGSMENRAKFSVMILDAIRQRVGRRMLIEYRVSGDEMEGDDGFGVKDCIDFLEIIQDKIDIAHISAGTNENTPDIVSPSSFSPSGRNTYLSEAVKKSGRIHVPVLTLGAYQMPEDIERVIAEGKADMVAMARGTIADAQLVNKARTDREDDIIPCIRCLYCLDAKTSESFACSVNPTIGRELQLKWLETPFSGKKKVVIVGGGPAGMEAAITARKRGHEVILLEKSDRLGGALKFSDQVWFKKPLNNFMNYLIYQTKKSGVDICLNVEATPEMVKDLQPDVVMAAVGAAPILPRIPGIDNKKVMFTTDIYHKVAAGEDVGEKIVVLGGDDIGCETAEFLCDRYGKHVEIVELSKAIASNSHPAAAKTLIDRVNEHAVVHLKTECIGINDEGMIIRDKDGEHQIYADTICISIGMRPESAKAEQFRDCAEEFFLIGDCQRPSSVRLAVRTGYDAAIQI